MPAPAQQQCTPTSIVASGANVVLSFTTVSPDGSGPTAGSVVVSAYGGDGQPLSPADLLASMKSACRAWYAQKFGTVAYAPALPGAFAIN